MKTIYTLLLTLFLSTFILPSVHASEVLIKLQNNFGFTAVDIFETKYLQGTMVDWNKFHYKGLIQLLVKPGKIIRFGGEVGFNRLYYWEEKYYISSSEYPRWRWGQAWTIDYGGILRTDVGKYFYTLTGFTIHTYFNGYGTHVGLPIGLGFTFPIGKSFALSTDYRNDLIAGRGTPFTISGGIGLNFMIKKQ